MALPGFVAGVGIGGCVVASPSSYSEEHGDSQGKVRMMVMLSETAPFSSAWEHALPGERPEKELLARLREA